MQKRRIAAVVIAAVMVFGTISASAKWISAGYDTTDLNNIGKIYNEVINGKYTSKIKVDALDEKDIVWKNEGYELAYPHAGYDRLYLEGNKQNITRYNNLFPQWETRFADYMWEICVDAQSDEKHLIYQRQQTKVPGHGWVWDFSEDPAIDSEVFVPTTRYAKVTEAWKHYGVGQFDLKGNRIPEEIAAMYERFGLTDPIFEYKADSTKEIADYTFFSDENLSERLDNGHFKVTNEEIAEKTGSIVSKFLTGPTYRGENPTKDVAAIYLENPEWEEWDYRNYEGVMLNAPVKYGYADVEWTNPMYEMAEPYKMYQYLIVNGVVLDGHNDTPRVFRYTGGKATPKVEWKYAFAEAPVDSQSLYVYNMDEKPFNVIEFKYVDGKLALDEVTGQPIYRVPTGVYANVYAKSTANTIQIWLKDDVSNVMIKEVPRTSTTGYYGGYTNGGVFVAN